MSHPVQLTRLTPPGTGAIGVLEIRGIDAWNWLSKLISPIHGQVLPHPRIGKFFLARLQGLEEELVILIRQTSPEWIIELQGHGGETALSVITDLLVEAGAIRSVATAPPLANAETIRSAQILLDQKRFAFARRIEECLTCIRQRAWTVLEQHLKRLLLLEAAGCHLTTPFHVTIAGAPNVGKSSLMNALAGYQRSVVTATPGTTRDVVSIKVALEGWLVELVDTAGLRETEDPIERAGIDKARELISQTDLCLWLLDSTSTPIGPTLRLIEFLGISRETLLFVLNKCDQKPTWDIRELPDAVKISAQTGLGIPLLVERTLKRLLPAVPTLGEGVPTKAETVANLKLALDLVRSRDESKLIPLLETLLQAEP